MEHIRGILIFCSTRLFALKIILLSIIPLSLFAQESKLNFSKIDSADLWLSSQKRDSIYFKLLPVYRSTYKTHIRISFPGQIIDLYSKNQTFKGVLTTYLIEYDSKKTQYVYQKIDLDSTLCTKAALKLLSTGQDTIPTDTLIKSWNEMFFDCNGIEFEFKTGKKYTKQIYSCPWGQNDSAPYVHTILANYDTITKEFDLKAHYKTFTDYLPKGKTYSTNGFGSMYVFTQKEKKKWQKIKPYIEYLDSVEITLNKYLSDTLTKLFKAYNGLRCYDKFSLKFSKNNKLIKVTANSKFLNSEDRKDYHTGKKKIKEAFQHIQINFVHSKIAYWRELDYDGNKVFITDNYSKIE